MSTSYAERISDYIASRSTATKLVAAAAVGSALTASSILGYQALNRRRRRRDLSAEIEEALLESTAKTPRTGTLTPAGVPERRTGKELKRPWNEDLVREQLSRNIAFFGEEGVEKIRNGFVIIVGMGGVGSWAATMLVRSGVSRVRLIDFDQVTLSSLNRHATARLEDVGMPKVYSVQKFLEGVAPWAEIDPRVELWRGDKDGEELLSGDPDWVLDCIDHIPTKVELLKTCHDKGIKVFSSMGAGAKADPSRIQISDISNTLEDPLARSIRRRLKQLGVTEGIPVVYSTEKPSDIKLLPLPEEEFQKGKVHELSAIDDFRVRLLPVLGPLPAMFGLAAATYVLLKLAGRDFQPLAIKNRPKLYEKLHRDLFVREGRRTGEGNFYQMPLSEPEVGYIFDDLFGAKSVIPPHAYLTRPALVRWDVNEPLTTDNVVVMRREDAEKHEAECNVKGRSPEEVWGEDVVQAAEKKTGEARAVKDWNF